jgi:hypothetical protein
MAVWSELVFDTFEELWNQNILGTKTPQQGICILDKIYQFSGVSKSQLFS